MKKRELNQLLHWFDTHKRDLPFRKSRNPYEIYVSEIMLQQTQVKTVIPYFNDFIKRFPHVSALAATTEEILKKQVEGLGYYRRFSHMYQASRIIERDYLGMIPNDYQSLLKLPGIGQYTAGAIMSIAYNQPYAATDGNVLRVFSRYYGIKEDINLATTKDIIHQLHQKNIEQVDPNTYQQAVMELGALVCKKDLFQCQACPIYKTCYAYQHGSQKELPFKSKKADKKQFNYISIILIDGGKIALVRRSETLLQGFYQYPQFDSESISHVIDLLESDGIVVTSYQYVKKVIHQFTHQTWINEVFEINIQHIKPSIYFDWYDLETAKTLPMATIHKKIKTLN